MSTTLTGLSRMIGFQEGPGDVSKLNSFLKPGTATGLSFLGLTSTSEVTRGTNLFWVQNGASLLAWWTFISSGLAVNSLNPVMKVCDQIADVLTTHLNLSWREACIRAEDLLNIVNIDRQRVNAYPHELSSEMPSSSSCWQNRL